MLHVAEVETPGSLPGFGPDDSKGKCFDPDSATDPQVCADACDALYACAEPVCEGWVDGQPGLAGRQDFLDWCLPRCVEDSAVVDAVVANDCAASVANARASLPGFVSGCDAAP